MQRAAHGNVVDLIALLNDLTGGAIEAPVVVFLQVTDSANQIVHEGLLETSAIPYLVSRLQELPANRFHFSLNFATASHTNFFQLAPSSAMLMTLF